MKKIISSILYSVVLSVGVISCSQDEMPDVKEPGKFDPTKYETLDVVVNAQDAIRSRGADANGMFGDGSEATKLQYQVWKVMTNDAGTVTSGTCVIDSRLTGTTQAEYKGNGQFSIKLVLLKNMNNNEKGSYVIRTWADAWGDDKNSPYTLYWDDFDGIERELKGWKNTYRSFQVNYWKALGTFDKADVFCNKAHVLASLDLKTKNTDVVLKRPMAQVCVVTPEFNDKPEGYESSYRMLAIPNCNKDGDGFYWPGNCDNYDMINQDAQSITDSKVVASNARINIEGKEMRYLFMGYIIPYFPNGIKVVYGDKSIEKVIDLVNGASFDYENSRIIIYPKNTDHGGGFYSEEEEVDLNVIIQPGFSNTTNSTIE